MEAQPYREAWVCHVLRWVSAIHILGLLFAAWGFTTSQYPARAVFWLVGFLAGAAFFYALAEIVSLLGKIAFYAERNDRRTAAAQSKLDS